MFLLCNLKWAHTPEPTVVEPTAAIVANPVGAHGPVVIPIRGGAHTATPVDSLHRHRAGCRMTMHPRQTASYRTSPCQWAIQAPGAMPMHLGEPSPAPVLCTVRQTAEAVDLHINCPGRRKPLREFFVEPVTNQGLPLQICRD